MNGSQPGAVAAAVGQGAREEECSGWDLGSTPDAAQVDHHLAVALTLRWRMVEMTWVWHLYCCNENISLRLFPDNRQNKGLLNKNY